MEKNFKKKLFLIFLFSIAFAFVESAVVIYLRAIYYPQGFHFPIKRHYDLFLVIEIIREFATLVMMVSLSILISKKFWEGFGFFLVIFGIWDIFFYLWLKLTIGWPESIMTFDVLFLIPIPWIAPVLAPILISILMIIIGFDIIRFFEKGSKIMAHLIHWIIVLSGTACILYSFMHDIDAAFYEKYPYPFNWVLFSLGLTFYTTAYMHLRRTSIRNSVG